MWWVVVCACDTRRNAVVFESWQLAELQAAFLFGELSKKSNER
jgi:hypothetical protein